MYRRKTRYRKRNVPYFTRYKPTGYRFRSKRIFKKFIKRRAIKPELKYVIVNQSQQVGLQSGSGGPTFSTTLSADSITQGSTVQNRIGAKVNIIKVDVNILIKDNSNQTFPLVAPKLGSYLVRIICWAPRTTVALAQTYMTALSINSNIDFHQATVYHDKCYNFAISYISETTSNDPAPGMGMAIRNFKWKFKFPRKVHLPQGQDELDVEKYVMFITYIANDLTGAGIVFYQESKTWFYDS